MNTWEFDVAISTHERLREGIVEAGYVRVKVAAETHLEASLVAIQMATVAGYPTAVYDRI